MQHGGERGDGRGRAVGVAARPSPGWRLGDAVDVVGCQRRQHGRVHGVLLRDLERGAGFGPGAEDGHSGAPRQIPPSLLLGPLRDRRADGAVRSVTIFSTDYFAHPIFWDSGGCPSETKRFIGPYWGEKATRP